jgi:transposase
MTPKTSRQKIYVCLRCRMPKAREDEVINSAIGQYGDDEYILQEFSKDFSEYLVIMLMDKTWWHVSHSLEIPENIRLLKLPPYSPELNPAEHIWEELREKNMMNKAFATLDAVDDTLCKGLNDLAGQPERLRSLTNFPYLRNTY